MSQETSFCSRCGYLLTGTAELLRTGGVPQTSGQETYSERRQGVRQGIAMIMAMIVLAPVVGLISTFVLGMEPWPVGIVIAVLGMGGILRIIYSLLFLSKYPASALSTGAALRTGEQTQLEQTTLSALPPLSDLTASEYAGPETNRRPELRERQPSSVTESTTRHLKQNVDSAPDRD